MKFRAVVVAIAVVVDPERFELVESPVERDPTGKLSYEPQPCVRDLAGYCSPVVLE